MAQKLRRLQVILAERTNWAAQLVQVKGMRQWVRDAEHILDGSWAQADEVVTNATVGQRLDAWRQQMAQQVTDARLSELEQECLAHFLQILTHLRPHLVQCSDRKDFPRTVPRARTQHSGPQNAVSSDRGRKNWNSYLLRYGRSVAYAAWWEQDTVHRKPLEHRAARLDRARWRELRRETKAAQSEQLKRFRFRHKRQAYLASLEGRWAAVSPPRPLP